MYVSSTYYFGFNSRWHLSLLPSRTFQGLRTTVFLHLQVQVKIAFDKRLQFVLFHKETRHLSSERECLRSQASSEPRRRGLQWVALLGKIFENVLKRCLYCSWDQTNSFNCLQAHWDGMLNLWNDYHCKIKETLFIQQLQPHLYVDIIGQKLTG